MKAIKFFFAAVAAGGISLVFLVAGVQQYPRFVIAIFAVVALIAVPLVLLRLRQRARMKALIPDEVEAEYELAMERERQEIREAKKSGAAMVLLGGRITGTATAAEVVTTVAEAATEAVLD